jgi:hypothetical protein
MHHRSFLHSLREARRPAVRFAALALSLAALSVLGSTGGCSSDVEGPSCVGGFLTTDGQCEGKCSRDKCIDPATNTCVNNRCVLECNSHSECLPDGSQACAPAVEDDTKRELLACQPRTGLPGAGATCPFGTECRGFGKCSGSGAVCNLNQCSGSPGACTLDQAACAGNASCTIGKCPDNTACTVLPCPVADCKLQLTCLSKGEGDADAYCAQNDCSTDADCGSGYYCGLGRIPNEHCDKEKGNNLFCGELPSSTPSSERCIDASTFGKENTVAESMYCLERKMCLKRDECAPCETDFDCSLFPARRCSAMPKEEQKRCVQTCVKDTDCGADFSCEPADAAKPDGGSVCIHRTGACVGAGKYCDPCLNDADCGGLGGNLACDTSSSGQRGCTDPSFSVECMTDMDCPVSPSGKRPPCILNAQSANYHRCYTWPATPVVAGDPNSGVKYGCW